MENRLRPAQPSPFKLQPFIQPGKLLVALFLSFFPLFTGAETAEEHIHENLELILDELPDLIYLQSFEASGDFSFKQELSFKPAFVVRQELAYHKSGFSARLNTLLKEGNLDPKFQLALAENYYLGHYRFAWGGGLCLPKKGSSRALPPPAPSNTYSPLGYSLMYEHKNWQIMHLASYQNRTARLVDGKIAQLPQTKSQGLEDTAERIFAGALGYQMQSLSLGALLYTQSYEHEFMNPALASSLYGYGLYGRYEKGIQSFAIEFARQKRLSTRVNWLFQPAPFSCSIAYSHLNDYQKPAYTPHPGRLGRQANQEEFRSQLSWQASKTLKVESSAAFYKQKKDLAKSAWLNEVKLSLKYRDKQTNASLSLSGLDQEILSALDEDFQPGRPRHYRLSLSSTNRLGAYRHRALFRHQYQEMHPDIRQNNWWKQALNYHFGKANCGLGYSFYSGGKRPMYVPDDGMAGYERLVHSRLELEANFELRLSKWHLKLKAQKELSGARQLKGSLFFGYKQ